MANKIKYGLKNVYYAVATIAADGSATYDTPVALPGAVSISLDPQGDTTPFYADNVEYWTGISNTGYEGDLEVARLTDAFKTDILGYITSGNGLSVEDANANPVHFALMFQFEGDVKATRHVMYNCTASRASAAGNTKSETIEPQTETVTITATSVYVAALDTDVVKAETNESTSSTVYDGFFTAVTLPTKVSG